MLSRWATETPGVVGFPAATWDNAMGALPFAERVLSAFRTTSPRFGLSEYGDTFRLNPDRSWDDFYADSVFFPGAPVFNGASVIQRFSNGHAQRLLADFSRRSGRRGAPP
jgi:hypothetical protein